MTSLPIDHPVRFLHEAVKEEGEGETPTEKATTGKIIFMHFSYMLAFVFVHASVCTSECVCARTRVRVHAYICACTCTCVFGRVYLMYDLCVQQRGQQQLQMS